MHGLAAIHSMNAVQIGQQYKQELWLLCQHASFRLLASLPVFMSCIPASWGTAFIEDTLEAKSILAVLVS